MERMSHSRTNACRAALLALAACLLGVLLAPAAQAAPPDTVINSGPSGPTNDNTPRFTFFAVGDGSGGATFRCAIDLVVVAPCPSPITTFPLADGRHTFAVAATELGQTDPTPAVRSFVVDTVDPPTPTIDSGPSGQIHDLSPTFMFSVSGPDADDVRFQCWFDGELPHGCASPYFSPLLALGAHQFSVKAIDAAGNVGAAAHRSFFVLQPIPDTIITSGPSGPTNDNTPSFKFAATVPGAFFSCSVDGLAPVGCDNIGFATFPLADGRHTFSVAAGLPTGEVDPTPATSSFVVDTVAPVTRIDSGPGASTSSTMPTFTFSASEPDVRFTCILDLLTVACDAGSFTTPLLGPGVHHFAVHGFDQAQNPGPAATRDFEVVPLPHK
jgi:hypothetical protein